MRPIILSAGGTGGHMFPAAALAAELQMRGVPVIIASDGRGADYKNAFTDIPFHAFSIGRPSRGKVRFVFGLLRGIFQACRLVRKNRPAAVVGFGGYPSAPAICAAYLLGVPIILHEQNATLGRANARFGVFARKIALSYENTRGVPTRLQSKLTVTGPLVRADIVALHDAPYPTLAEEGPLHILIMGGSQGARVLSTILPAALATLPPGLRARLRIVQQSRSEDVAEAREIYQAGGINARIEPFITDVSVQLAQAHLFIGRAGGTVAEVTAAGRPALYIPYPHHADQQQQINAGIVAAAGAGWMMTEDTLTPESLATKLSEILFLPDTLINAAAAARHSSHPHSSARLAKILSDFNDQT